MPVWAIVAGLFAAGGVAVVVARSEAVPAKSNTNIKPPPGATGSDGERYLEMGISAAEKAWQAWQRLQSLGGGDGGSGYGPDGDTNFSQGSGDDVNTADWLNPNAQNDEYI